MYPANLLRLLRARDPALVDQGVELAAALGDPLLFDDLLSGIGYGEQSSARRFRDAESRWVFVPNKLFSGSRAMQPFLDRAILTLLASAPHESKVASELKANVVELQLDGPMEGIPLNLASFKIFPKLEKLHLSNVRPLKTAALLPQLQVLTIQGGLLPEGLKGLEAPRLQELSLVGVGCSSLEGLEGAPELELLRLHGLGEPCLLSGLEYALRLKALALSGIVPVGELDLALLPCLEELALHGFAPATLVGLLKLRSLSLTDPPQLPFLDRLPELQHLRVSLLPDSTGMAKPSFSSSLSNLTWLELEADDLEDLRDLTVFPKLHTLDLRTHSTCLSGLSKLPVSVLSITASRAQVLALPEGLEEASCCAPQLLELQSLPASLKKLYLPGCSALETLSLEGLTQLEQLSMDGCQSLKILEGTAGLYRLETLDLRGTRSLQHVPVLQPGIRAIAIDGSALSRHLFPQALRPILTTDPSADLEVLKSTAPKTHSALSEESEFTLFLRRLRIRDLSAVDAAIADLSASIEANPERAGWFDRLLSGTGLDTLQSSYSRREGVFLVPGPLLAGSRVEAPYRDHALRALIAAAPPGSKEAQRLKDSLIRLSLSGHISLRREPDAAVDLRSLKTFPKLMALSVEAAHPLLGLESLASSPLESLQFLDCTLNQIELLPVQLTHLRLSGLVGLQKLPSLERLLWLEHLELERLELDSLEPLGVLPRLKSLRIRHMPRLADLSLLSTAITLETLELEDLAVSSLAPLARLPLLGNLILTGLPALSDISPLASTRLTSLQLKRLYRLKDLKPLSRIPSLISFSSDSHHG
jgi:hypothetical protein